MERELRTDSDRARRKELLNLKFERDALAAVLDFFPIGIVVLDPDLDLLQMNRVARQLLDQSLPLTAPTTESTSIEKLTAVITDLIGRTGDSDVRFHHLAGKRRSMKQAYEMLLISLEEDEPSGSPTVIFLCDPTQEQIADPRILQAAYDFTPTEAAVAAKLVDGLSLEEIATELGVELSTARSHLKRIFTKTGTHRQAELVCRLMQGLSRLSMQGARG